MLCYCENYCSRPVYAYMMHLYGDIIMGFEQVEVVLYNRCIKLFFGFKRWDSLTNILLTLGLPTPCPKISDTPADKLV